MKGTVSTLLTWIASGATGLVATIALAYASSTSSDIKRTSDELQATKTTVRVLCNDYGQTVSRMDQNLQAIGKALRVNVVSGSSNIDPCKAN